MPLNLRILGRLQKVSAFCAMPVFRYEIPGWGRVASLVGLTDDRLWDDASAHRIRGKLHGYLMDLDLTNWSERQTYFLGRFYDLPTQRCVAAILRGGDTFIDVGANVGMITLLAAHCLNHGGVVHAFEPNPQAFAQLRHNLSLNQLADVRTHDIALSDRAGEFTLSVLSKHTGSGTMAQVPQSLRGQVVSRHRINAVRGDDVLDVTDTTVATVKIDVEGHECHVLRGMTRILKHANTAVITEVVSEHLRRAGCSPDELFELLSGFGYQPFAIETHRHRLSHALALMPVESPEQVGSHNVLWLKPGSMQWHRLERALATRPDFGKNRSRRDVIAVPG